LAQNEFHESAQVARNDNERECGKSD
jgi:hypothetical protein